MRHCTTNLLHAAITEKLLSTLQKNNKLKPNLINKLKLLNKPNLLSSFLLQISRLVNAEESAADTKNAVDLVCVNMEGGVIDANHTVD